MTKEKATSVPPEFTSTLWSQVENYALLYLQQGRKGWDKPHTEAVVHYTQQLARAAEQDVLVLTTTAWLHDIGYFELFDTGQAKVYEQLQERKKTHMEIGAARAERFLAFPKVCSQLTQVQRERIVHLVGVHDEIARLSDTDEIILAEADTFGAIDLTRITPTLTDYEQARQYLEKSLYGKRVLKIRTEGSCLGNQILEELLPEFEKYVENLKS